jgi:hypothetical protein
MELGTSATRGIIGVTPYVELPNGINNTFTSFSLRAPDQWKSGQVTFRFHWSGDVSSTNNVKLTYVIDGYIKDENLAAASASRAIVSATLVPGPATLSTLKVNEESGVFMSYNPSIEIVVGTILRLDPDDYTGDLHIHGVELIYSEVKRFVGYQVPLAQR